MRLAFFIALLSGLPFQSLTKAELITVELEGGSGFTGIQGAIDAAQDGDTVLVSPGEYTITKPITFLGKAITVRGAMGSEQTTIRVLSEDTSVVVFADGKRSSPARLEGFTLTGASGRGSGIQCSGRSSPMIIDSKIAGNSGRGVRLSGESSPTLSNCQITGNDGGGIYCDEEASPTFHDSTIMGNSASFGGALYCRGDSSVTLTNCIIGGNSAFKGGAISCEARSSATLANCTVCGNSASKGGGIHCAGSASLSLINSIVWENLGGSIWRAQPATSEVTFSCIEGTEVWPGAGNIHNDPLFCGISAGQGVAVRDQKGFEDVLAPSAFSVALSPESPCLGTALGGGNMGADAGLCDVRNPEPSLRLAPGRYQIAGLALFHRLTIEGAGADQTTIEGTVFGLRTGAMISGVTVTGGTSGGMVVAPGQAPEIRSCMIAGNSRGGVICEKDSLPTLTNCLISGNLGSGITCERSSSPMLTNCTIVGNWLSGVDGKRDSFATLTNCIVWDNTGASISGYGLPSDIAYSCIESAEPWPGEANINRDPHFLAPGIFLFDDFVHGKPDFLFEPGDYSLRPESPAIDVGASDIAPSTDLKGFRRPCGKGVDMGAYETGNCRFSPPFLRGDADGSGILDISDPVYNLRFQFFGDVRPGCFDALDDDDSGAVDLSDPIFSLAFQYLGAKPTPTPGHTECGSDPTDDGLTCEYHPSCEAR